MPSRCIRRSLKILDGSKLVPSALGVPCSAKAYRRYPAIHIQYRVASTLTSSSAVNASKTIPDGYKELYEALLEVRKRAPASVKLSRLQLGLQGLESERLMTRIAVLGLNNSAAARRVIRILLADSLKQKENWEDELEKYGGSQGILLRYGTSHDSNMLSRRGPTPVLYIPSSILKQQNLEILVSSINMPDAAISISQGAPCPPDTFLVPAVGIPISSSGLQTTLSYPVHKAFVLAEGFDGLLAVLRLLSRTTFQSPSDQTLVNNIVNSNAPVMRRNGGNVTLINSERAESGLDAIRADITRAPEFERGWMESNLSELLEKLIPTQTPNGRTIPELLRSLIESTLFETSSNIQQEADESEKLISSKAVPDETRAALRQSIRDFSVRGHTELQSGLLSAFTSVNWQKLAWYKLLWRADDVPLIVSDLVERSWLPQSERAVCELTGRLIQSELHALSADKSSAQSTSDLGNRMGDSHHPFSDLQSATPAEQISKARRTFIEHSISDLTSKAQTALMKAIALSTGSTALTALAYFSTPLAGVYECGSILGLGLVLALRQLQVDWETSRREWKESIFDAGSGMLKQIEAQMVRTVEEGGKINEDEVSVQSRKAAQQAVERALQALRKVP